MGFTEKLTFPEVDIQASASNLPVHVNTYENAFSGVSFFDLDATKLDEHSFAPTIKLFHKTLNSAGNSTNEYKVIFFPTVEDDGTAIDDEVLNAYLAFSLMDGRIGCLVRTHNDGWIANYRGGTLPSSPYPANGVVTRFELKMVGGGGVVIDGLKLSWVMATEEDWDNDRFPQSFIPGGADLSAFTVFGEIQDASTGLDIPLIPNDDQQTFVETVDFLLRYDKRIEGRSRFTYDSKEYNVSRFDVTGRKRFISLQGSREVERVT